MVNKADLRPKTFSKFIGKQHLIKSIKTGIEAAKKTQQAFDHCLFYGPPGVGKTTLAHIIAHEFKARICVVQSTSVQTIADLMSLLSNIKDFDILFIDEIHSLNKNIVEILYPAMEDNVIDIMIGKNYASKTVRLKLPQFTLIGATTHLGMLPKALEERFGYVFFIDVYQLDELKQIIQQTLKIYNLEINEEEIDVIISNSRGIPRNVNRIIKRIYDHRILNKKTPIKKIIQESGYIINGLTEIDLKYLLYLYNSKNWSASLKSISQGINIDEKTILDKIEPYLVKIHYLIKSSKGRTLTNKCFNLIYSNNLHQNKLIN